jgi:hypothetical protein
MIDILLLGVCMCLFVLGIVFTFKAMTARYYDFWHPLICIILSIVGMGLFALGAVLAINMCKDCWWFPLLPYMYFLAWFCAIPLLIYFTFPPPDDW